MAIFTIHVPRDRVEPEVLARRLEIVPEDFSWGAFFLGPLWLIRNRLWFALILWGAAFVFLWLIASLRFPLSVLLGLLLLVEFLLGLEGNGLLASALRRRGLDLAGIVAAPEADAALRIFFQRSAPARVPQPAAAARPVPRGVAADDEFVGLSPERGG